MESMGRALAEYTKLIKTGEAFEGSCCVVHFKHECDKVSLSYFEEYPDLVRYLEESSYYYNKKSDRENLQLSTTGEALFFLCAVMHPELEEDVKAACEAIVNYSRKLNNSSYMRLTCEHPFGVEPLHITAVKYPKYGYLLASYLVPYWECKHMPEALFTLGNWSNKLGITDDTLKAFCYCDNSRARENMLGYDTWDGNIEEGDEAQSSFDLITHFRKDPQEYLKFKELLAERYRKMPFLQVTEDIRDYNENPIHDMVMEILYVHHPYEIWADDFDRDIYLKNTFVTTRGDEEIEEIKSYIEERLGGPIVTPKEEILK